MTMCTFDWRRPARTLGVVALLAAVTTLAACAPDRVLGNGQLPPNVPDPAATRTPEGALNAYRGTLVELRRFVSDAVLTSGLVSDELRSPFYGAPAGVTDPAMVVDSHNMPEYTDRDIESSLGRPELYRAVYSNLQEVRNQAGQSIGLLRDFSPNTSPALIGHMYAVEGYVEILLADLYCSGIPLSTIDYNGDFTLEDGTPTLEVYARAAALLDSAIALSADSARILNLARVGKARALLARGEYAAAAALAAQVPDGFSYQLIYAPASVDGGIATNFAYIPSTGQPSFTVSDTEGVNGLDYRSSGDPRTATIKQTVNQYGEPMYVAKKYNNLGSSPIVLADAIEARLIEAEAQLNGAAAGDWLTTLNTLRTTGAFTGVDTVVARVDTTVVGGTPQIDTTYRYDTLWVAGTGGVAGLGPLRDPGTPDARVNLLFRERAFWLFLTGHRQGDMRRLIRQYGRDPDTVYPVGGYRGGAGTYGPTFTLPIPAVERASNPKFTGCINRGA
ncbi:MAG: hypothetical protein IRY91_08815 [Gemmatimonadaceae bacterium]|nr:hypothetical protein [Gemmatimonadaceae bacterium]